MARIALIGDNSVEYVNELLDIWNGGNCAVLVDWKIPFQEAYLMMREANVISCHIEKSIFEKIGFSIRSDSISFCTFEVDNSSARCLPQETFRKYSENTSQAEAVILYSSGTTGKSKGIILSHYAISRNADAILDYMALDKQDCIYIAKSLSHSSTLTGELLVALKSRTRLILGPTIVPPRYVLNQIARFNVTTLCLNPTLIQMYIDEMQRRLYFVHSLKTIYVSGSILNDNVYQAAHTTLMEFTYYKNSI